MEYRTLGRTGIEVSAIGLGTEHLPRKRQVMEQVLRTAVEAGVSYMDLLYVQPDYWDAFGDLYRTHRDRIVAAVHWNAPECYDDDINQRTFDNILATLGNDRAEVGLITMVDSAKVWKDGAQRAIERLQRYQEQGRIGGIGMSSHNPKVARQAVESGQIDVLMFGLNLLGHGSADERALLHACAEQGVGVVAMKAYHGGTLFAVNGQPTGITPAQCLAYTLSLPVATAVPGPKNLDELRATLRYLEATPEEKDYRSLPSNLRDILRGQCVTCFHCLPCPQEIEIAWMIWLVDQARGRVTKKLREEYKGFKVPASACTACGICLERCPYDVDILAKLQQAAELFE